MAPRKKSKRGYTTFVSTGTRSARDRRDLESLGLVGMIAPRKRARDNDPLLDSAAIGWPKQSTENADLLMFLRVVHNHNLTGDRSIGMIFDVLDKDRGAIADVARFLACRADGLPVQIVAGRRVKSLSSPFIIQLLGMIEHAGIEGRNLVPADLTAMLEEVMKRYEDQCINIYGDKVPRRSHRKAA